MWHVRANPQHVDVEALNALAEAMKLGAALEPVLPLPSPPAPPSPTRHMLPSCVGGRALHGHARVWHVLIIHGGHGASDGHTDDQLQVTQVVAQDASLLVSHGGQPSFSE